MPRKRKRDQDGIHQRPDSPFWWATIPNGRGGSTRRSTQILRAEDPDGVKAAALRATWLTEGPPDPVPTGPTFDDLMLAYLGQVTPTKRAPQRDQYSARALFPVFRSRKLADLGAAEVRGYIATRTAMGAQPGTINKEVGLMSAALNWARREMEWDLPNPWERRRQREPTGRTRWLTQSEAQRLIEAARHSPQAPHLEDFLRLGLYAGLRPGEILGLTWQQIDGSRSRIQFAADRHKNGQPGNVPLNQQARAALRARFRAAYCPDAPWVFCAQEGKRIASIRRSFATAVRRAQLLDVHPHDLRRTFGSWLVQVGVGIERISKLLRHADIQITARVYAHLRSEDLAEAAAILDRSRYQVSRSGFTLPDEIRKEGENPP